MSYRVFVREGKIYKNSWDCEIRKYTEKEAKSFLPLLNFPIEIENTSFGQFLMLLEHEVETFQKIYNSALYGHPLKDFIEECKIAEGKPENVEHVEVYWHGEIDEHKLYPDEDNGVRPFGEYLGIDAGFHGWGPWNDSMSPPDFKGGLAIEFTPVYDYQMVPLRLNKKLDIYKWGSDPKKIFKEPVLTCFKEFTVHEVISAILFEISFSGSPVDRDQKAMELKAAAKDAKELYGKEGEINDA